MKDNVKPIVDMNGYEVFFFDFDGVIVDSLGIKAEAFGSLFEEYGKEVMDKVIEYHFDNGGVSRYEKFKYYYNELLGKEITSEISDNLDKQYSAKVVEKVVSADEIPGAIDLLKELKRQNKLCFVVSATPQEEIRRITRMKGIDGLFKDVVGSPRKKGENLKLLLEEYYVSLEKAVFFGDAKSDYEAARSNGVDFIGVCDGKNGELSALEGIVKIKNFRQLVL
ncbi:MAG: HAD hydrolase-like protein [Candidatus Omnitrophota bacterium]